MSRKKKIFLVLLSAIGSLCLMIGGLNLWVVVSTNKKIYTDVSKIPACDVGLVLGTSPHFVGGHENLFFKNRIEAAATLYFSRKIKKLLVSGDNGNANYNETEAMRKALVQKGIPEKDIVMDYAGFRTFDSVVRSKEVFGQYRIILISQRFHLQRGIFIAGSFGIEAYGFEAADPPRGSFVMFREIFARVAAVLDCYLLGTKPKYPGPKAPIQFDPSTSGSSPEAR